MDKTIYSPQSKETSIKALMAKPEKDDAEQRKAEKPRHFLQT